MDFKPWRIYQHTVCTKVLGKAEQRGWSEEGLLSWFLFRCESLDMAHETERLVYDDEPQTKEYVNRPPSPETYLVPPVGSKQVLAQYSLKPGHSLFVPRGFRLLIIMLPRIPLNTGIPKSRRMLRYEAFLFPSFASRTKLYDGLKQ